MQFRQFSLKIGTMVLLDISAEIRGLNPGKFNFRCQVLFAIFLLFAMFGIQQHWSVSLWFFVNIFCILKCTRSLRVSATPHEVPVSAYWDSAGCLLSTAPRWLNSVICLPDVHSDIINNILLILLFVPEILLNAVRSFIWFVCLFLGLLCMETQR